MHKQKLMCDSIMKHLGLYDNNFVEFVDLYEF